MATEIGKGTIPIGFDKTVIEADARAAILPGLQRVAGDAALLFVGKKLFDFGKSGLDALEQAQRVTAQTEAQLKATGGAAGVTAKDIDQLAGSMRDLAGFDDEAARSAANVLLRFSNIQGADTFKRVEKDAADLAVTMGTDLPAAAQTLGQILQSPETAARKLRPIIGALSDAQQASVKAFLDQGDAAGAVNLILTDLEGKIGGTAKNFGETLPGQVAKSQAALKEMKESLVGGLAPALNLGAQLTTRLAEGVTALPDPLRESVGALALLGGGAVALLRPAGDLLRLLEASKAAHLANAAATQADAAATVENAVAQNSAASVSGLYATKASGLSSVLGKAGLVAALAAVTTGLYEYGQSLNHTTLSTDQLAKFTSASSDELGKAGEELLALAQAGGPFGGMLDDALKKLEGMGASGVGAIQRMRDAIAATGGDTSKFDAALADAKAAQDNLNASTQAGTADLGDNSSATLTNADMQKRLEDALQSTATSRKNSLDAARGLFDAEQSLTSAEHGVESAHRAVTDAQRGVGDANRRVEDSYRSLTDAEQRLTEAQDALTKAQQPADAETLGKAQLDLADAHLRVGDAQSAVTAAEKEAAKERKDGQHTAADVADADRKVEEAKNALQRALFGETDAEKALQDVQAKGTDQDQAVVEAKKQVADATKGVDDATRSLADSQTAVADANQRVIDAKGQLNDAYITAADAAGKVADAQILLHGGAVSVKDALKDQLQAFQDVDALLIPGSPERSHLDDYIKNLFVLAGIFQTTQTGGLEVNFSSGNGGVVRDSGGPLRPLQMFRNVNDVPELLLVPGSGTYQAPDMPSMVLSDQQATSVFAGLGGGRGDGRPTFTTGPITIVNPESEPPSSSIARELAIMSDKYAVGIG